MTQNGRFPEILEKSHKETVEIYLEKIGEPLPNWENLDKSLSEKMVRTYAEIQIKGQGDPVKAAEWRLSVLHGLDDLLKRDEKKDAEDAARTYNEIDEKVWGQRFPEFSDEAQKIIDAYWNKYYPNQPQSILPQDKFLIRCLLRSESKGRKIPTKKREDYIKLCLKIPNETYGLPPSVKQEKA